MAVLRRPVQPHEPQVEHTQNMTASISYDGGLTAGINVKNLDAAVAWYSDVLGMKLLYKLDDMGWGELKSPVGRVNVGLSQQTEVAGGGGAKDTPLNPELRGTAVVFANRST